MYISHERLVYDRVRVVPVWPVAKRSSYGVSIYLEVLAVDDVDRCFQEGLVLVDIPKKD